MRIQLYIPFWIYSNEVQCETPGAIGNLYIPFWIYSNLSWSVELQKLLHFTFHSGYIPMELERIKKQKEEPLHSILDIFQFYLLLIPPVFICLYIPFWIYSNKIGLSKSNNFFRLYIPFWIYSNGRQSMKSLLFLNFTFHSGYIPIIQQLRLFFSLYFFTFHSGYIPIY